MTKALSCYHRLATASQAATDWTTNSSVSDNTMPLCLSALIKCTDGHKLHRRLYSKQEYLHWRGLVNSMTSWLSVSPAGELAQQSSTQYNLNGQINDTITFPRLIETETVKSWITLVQNLKTSASLYSHWGRHLQLQSSQLQPRTSGGRPDEDINTDHSQPWH